jgi:hypothetical protein
MTTKTKPVHELRLGRIRAAVWANPVDGMTRYNVTFSRLYKDEEGWKDSTSFGREDLPLLGSLRPADRVIDGCGLIPPKGGHHHGPRPSAGRAEGTAVATLDR